MLWAKGPAPKRPMAGALPAMAAPSPRVHVDRRAIAPALRDAFVGLAGIDQRVDQPAPDADDDEEEDEQHHVVAVPLALGLDLAADLGCPDLGRPVLGRSILGAPLRLTHAGRLAR